MPCASATQPSALPAAQNCTHQRPFCLRLKCIRPAHAPHVGQVLSTVEAGAFGTPEAFKSILGPIRSSNDYYLIGHDWSSYLDAQVSEPPFSYRARQRILPAPLHCSVGGTTSLCPPLPPLDSCLVKARAEAGAEAEGPLLRQRSENRTVEAQPVPIGVRLTTALRCCL